MGYLTSIRFFYLGLSLLCLNLRFASRCFAALITYYPAACVTWGQANAPETGRSFVGPLRSTQPLPHTRRDFHSIYSRPQLPNKLNHTLQKQKPKNSPMLPRNRYLMSTGHIARIPRFFTTCMLNLACSTGQEDSRRHNRAHLPRRIPVVATTITQSTLSLLPHCFRIGARSCDTRGCDPQSSTGDGWRLPGAADARR